MIVLKGQRKKDPFVGMWYSFTEDVNTQGGNRPVLTHPIQICLALLGLIGVCIYFNRSVPAVSKSYEYTLVQGRSVDAGWESDRCSEYNNGFILYIFCLF